MAYTKTTVDNALWQLNEAVSLLRDALMGLEEHDSLTSEIQDGLPAMQDALKALAAEQAT